MTERPDLDIDLEIAKFRDYEFKDPHSNWDATFRNWIRNARKDAGGKAIAGQRMTPAQQREANARAVYNQVVMEQQNEEQSEG